MPKITRRKFFRDSATGAGLLVFVATTPCLANESPYQIQEKSAKKIADAFLDQISISPLNKIHTISLTYDVHLKVDWNIRMKMQATIWMQQMGDAFSSSFAMSEPEGVNAWSWLMLRIFGKQTQDYKDMMRGVEVTLIERFHRDKGRFRTEVMEESLPKVKYYVNQTAIKVRFDYPEGLIRFWSDKFQSKFSKTMVYRNQIGPLTAFFNYLYSEPPDTRMSLINVLKQVVDDDSGQTSLRKKRVRYIFESQAIAFGPNTSGQQTGYDMMLSLDRGNFLDILFGEYLYFQMAKKPDHNLKIPYAAHVEGIISKNKKRKKLKILKKQHPTQESFEKQLLEEVDDILAARNIKVFLTGYDVSLKQ